jgi:hypothetical protein
MDSEKLDLSGSEYRIRENKQLAQASENTAQNKAKYWNKCLILPYADDVTHQQVSRAFREL